jgi:hypothetical protein
MPDFSAWIDDGGRARTCGAHLKTAEGASSPWVRIPPLRGTCLAFGGPQLDVIHKVDRRGEVLLGLRLVQQTRTPSRTMTRAAQGT